MDQGDPYILAAMDGQETVNTSNLVSTEKRQEPTAFFHVIFGLVYEALVTSSTDSTSSSTRQNLVVSALQALKSLVKPEYSGNAFKDPTIFEEFISLCYRMAMTEPASIQVHLVEMISSFASSQEYQSRLVRPIAMTLHYFHSSHSSVPGTSFPLLHREHIV
jgi:hypothetical protein